MPLTNVRLVCYLSSSLPSNVMTSGDRSGSCLTLSRSFRSCVSALRRLSIFARSSNSSAFLIWLQFGLKYGRIRLNWCFHFFKNMERNGCCKWDLNTWTYACSCCVWWRTPAGRWDSACHTLDPEMMLASKKNQKITTIPSFSFLLPPPPLSFFLGPQRGAFS